MSDVLYPVSLIGPMSVKHFTRVEADAFEDGGVATRRLWPDKYFKRLFEFTHSPLTLSEMDYLRAFYHARNGRFDTFWFRDNINRGGNAKVRFAMELDEAHANRSYPIPVTLEEVAPIRALPTMADVIEAAGATPLFWADPNREVYYAHAGDTIYPAGINDVYSRLTFPVGGGTAPGMLSSSILSQHQYYDCHGRYFVGSHLQLSGTQPAFTVLTFVRCDDLDDRLIVFASGKQGTNGSLGLEMNSDNEFQPWIGGGGTWINAVHPNDPNEWQSFAVTFAAASNSASLYANAALIGTDSNTRSYDSTDILDTALIGATTPLADIGHILIFNAALTLAQVKALHNLLGYQYGLATVA